MFADRTEPPVFTMIERLSIRHEFEVTGCETWSDAVPRKYQGGDEWPVLIVQSISGQCGRVTETSNVETGPVPS
jgi:hypothetical protein